jgi:hypothetical protein
MNSKGFQNLLEGTTWSKDVVVWVGSGDALSAVLENKRHLEIDLLGLFPEDESLPTSREDRAQLLKQKLDRKLREIKPSGSERLILHVLNAPLLARYGVGLQYFYDWFGGSQTLAILEINRVKSVQLPSDATEAISFDPDWLVEYFRPLLAKPDNLCTEVD